MIDSLSRATHYLTGSSNIDALTAEDLEKIVNDYPYFPVAHFLLSKKLKKENSPHFLSQVQKTALYFPNPYWLHYQLLNDLPSEPIVYETEESPIQEVDQSIEHAPKHVEDALVVEEDNVSEIKDLNQDIYEHPPTEELLYEEIQEQLANDLNKPGGSSVRDESMHHDVIDEPDQEVLQPIEAIDVPAHTVTERDPKISDERNESATQAEEEMAAITRDTDETTNQFLDEVSEEAHSNNGTIATTEVTASPEPMAPEDDEHEKMFQNIKAMLDASAEEANAGVKSTIVPIDPYYTIDYFAAQGIKLDLEKNPQDKLGKQVKKFTQWLKHMKKLGPEDALASESPTPAEVEAQQTADASNIAREVVTEAMALVLEKQGKKDKAIQLYRKLTFLNPHKSAYFADKINHLNGL